MNRSPEDLDFLAYQRTGSSDALARVFDVLAPRLLLVASHFTKDANLAEDLVQTTFLQAMRDVQRYDPAQPVAHWLAAILRHRAMDAKRKADGLRTEEWQTQRDDGNDPARLAEDQESFEGIVRIIEELPAPFREVLLLRIVHGIQPTAMAHTLGRSPGTVRMQLKRGLERLRRALPEQAHCFAIFSVGSPQDLSIVREYVISQSQATAHSITSSTSVSAFTNLTMKKVLLAICATLLLVIPAWRMLPRSEQSDPQLASLEVELTTKSEESAPRGTSGVVQVKKEPHRLPISGPRISSVTIQLLDDLSGQPVLGMPVGLSKKGEDISRPKEGEPAPQGPGPEGHYLTVNDQGKATFHVSPGFDLRCTSPMISVDPYEITSPYLHANLDIAALEEGESKSFSLRLKRHKTLPFFTQIVDAGSGQPIQGAQLFREKVRTNSDFRANRIPGKLSFIDTRSWIPHGASMATSNQQGLIELEWRENAAQLYEVHASGYGPCWVQTSRNSVDALHATRIELHKTATLRGNLSSTDPGADVDFEIGIYAWPSSLVDRSSGTLDSDPYTWNGKTDEHGYFEISGLPTSGAISYWIEADGRLLEDLQEQLRLLPGEVRTMEWTYAPGESIEGLLLDDKGRPQSRNEVWLVKVPKAPHEFGWISWTGSDPDETTITDMAGRFQFKDLQPGVYIAGPAPSLSRGGYVKRLVIPSRGSVTLRPPTLMSIRGSVACEGTALPNVTVSSTSGFGTTTDEHGKFDLRCFPDREVSLTARQGPTRSTTYLCADRVMAQPGDQGVQLEMIPAASLHVEAIHSVAKTPMDVKFSIVPVDGDFGRHGGSNALQMTTFHEIRPGRHVVWAHSANGRAGYTDVLTASAGQELKAQVIHLQAAGTISMECPTLPRSTRIYLVKDDIRINSLWAFSPEESFSAPAGTYRIKVVPFESGTTVFETTVEVTAGKTSTIRVVLKD